MDDVDVLTEVEAIKRLKARYCRHLDAKDWVAWREVFSDDFVSDTSAAGGKVVRGGDAFVAFVQRTLGSPSRPTVHQVHTPEIELTSATTARGIWALEDFVRFAPAMKLQGFGHYHETYEKIDGQWRISSSTLTRVREDFQVLIFDFWLSHRLRRVIGFATRKLTKSVDD